MCAQLKLFFNSHINKKNLLSSWKTYSTYSTPYKAHSQINELLDASQPQSIVNTKSSNLIVHEINVYHFRLSIVVPNHYSTFIAPNLLNTYGCYPSIDVQRDWNQLFPLAHPIATPLLSLSDNPWLFSISLDSLKIIGSANSYTFCIKYHADADNYWHWTFDWLPRLWSLYHWMIANNISTSEIQFFSYGHLNSFQLDWLHLLFGNSLNVIYLSSPVQFLNCIQPNFSFSAHHNREYLDFLFQTVSPHLPNISSPSRIYIHRGHAKNGRNVTNESEILSLLTSLGFVSVSMDNLSIFQQASLFNSADIIIGPHGSAFVNMIYCQQNISVIEFFGPSYSSMHDFSLAHQCKLNWQCIFGESTNQNENSFTSDFVISLRALKQKLFPLIY